MHRQSVGLSSKEYVSSELTRDT